MPTIGGTRTTAGLLPAASEAGRSWAGVEENPRPPRQRGQLRTMPPTANRKLLAWVEEVAALTAADRVEWCDGSDAEYDRLCQLLVDNGTFTRLSDTKRPDSFWA